MELDEIKLHRKNINHPEFGSMLVKLLNDILDELEVLKKKDIEAPYICPDKSQKTCSTCDLYKFCIAKTQLDVCYNDVGKLLLNSVMTMGI